MNESLLLFVRILVEKENHYIAAQSRPNNAIQAKGRETNLKIWKVTKWAYSSDKQLSDRAEICV